MTLSEIRECTKKFSVLYVEDDEIIREAMKELLSFFFKNVDTGNDGLHALDVYNKNTHDIIMTDIQMPKMDGIEMLQTIRKCSPNIPIVIISAFSQEEYADKLKDLDVNLYLSKPISHENAKNAFYNVSKTLMNAKSL